jgi:hypothetical protein
VKQEPTEVPHERYGRNPRRYGGKDVNSLATSSSTVGAPDADGAAAFAVPGAVELADEQHRRGGR